MPKDKSDRFPAALYCSRSLLPNESLSPPANSLILQHCACCQHEMREFVRMDIGTMAIGHEKQGGCEPGRMGGLLYSALSSPI